MAQDYTVVYHTAAGGRGIDGVGLVQLPDGMMVAVVPIRRQEGWRCLIVRSIDGGRNWQPPVAELPYFTAAPFVHQGKVHLFAHANANLVLTRSQDGGTTWSDPVTLFDFSPNWYNCQTGMAVRHNRLYWAVGDLHVGDAVIQGRKEVPRIVVVAGDLGSDLMDPESWRKSPHVPWPGPGLPEQLLSPDMSDAPYPSMRMLEPNVLNVGGQLRVLATVKPPLQATTNLCAVFDVADDGEKLDLSFTQYHPMPGGQLKFCVIWDDVSQMFWATVNLAVDGQDQFEFKDPAEHGGEQPYSGAIRGNDRRFLMLFYGIDGLNWFPAGCVARAGRLGQSFMYPSHLVDGDDLLVIAWTSVNGDNRHDADVATFHRVRDFRRLAMNLRQDIDS